MVALIYMTPSEKTPVSRNTRINNIRRNEIGFTNKPCQLKNSDGGMRKISKP